MRPACASRSGATALAGGLLLIAGASPVPWAADGKPALHIVGIQYADALVEVTLLNPTQDRVTGKVMLEVRSEGRTTTVELPFAVWGGQKVFVQWVASAPVDGVRPLSIIVDDGAPL